MKSAELVGAQWRKSRYSGESEACVEVAHLDHGHVAIRDSKDHGHGEALVFTPGEWAAFQAGMADGEFG